MVHIRQRCWVNNTYTLIIPTLNYVYAEDCNFRYQFKKVKYCVTLDFLAAEDSVLLRRDTVPLGVQLPMFPSKWQQLLTQWHNITSQTAWIFKYNIPAWLKLKSTETDSNCCVTEACYKILVNTPFQANQVQRMATGPKRTRYPARHHLGTPPTHQTPAHPAWSQLSSLHLRCFERPPTRLTVNSWCSNIRTPESDAPTTADETHTSLC